MPDQAMQTEAAPLYRNRSIEIKDLAAALCKAQGAIDGAKKDAEAVITGNTKRSYADLASVWDAIRKPLTENDLCVVQFPRTVGNGVEIETTLLHGKTGQFMSDVLWVPCGKNDAQGIGSAITYGRRYSLMAVVGVCPVDDDGAAAVAGVTGSASSGGDFRPPGPRRFTGQMSDTNMRDEAERDGLMKNPPATKTAPATNGKKSAADKAKAWTDNAIGTIKLPGQHVESLDRWWKEQEKVPPGAKFSPLGWLEEAAPDEYERLTIAFNDIRSNAKQVAA